MNSGDNMKNFKDKDFKIVDVWKCNHCKNYIKETTKYCPHCGFEIKWQEKFMVSFYDIGKAEGIHWMEARFPNKKKEG